MSFKVIAGTFHVVGYSPDGDSIRFAPVNPESLSLLGGATAKMNSRGHVQLRLEAIDTLETHYEGHHQPPDLAEKAMDHLLMSLQIDGVTWNETHTKVISANDGTPGFIVAREVEKNGRPVSFAYLGQSEVDDGNDIFVDEPLLGKSINVDMLRSGLAYPTYYTGIFSDLRSSLTQIVLQARKQGLGVWDRDVTNQGFDVTSLESITENNVILPKLFRRIAKYLDGGGSGEGFKRYLEGLQEKITIISTVHSTHFDSIIEESGVQIRMTEKPENVIFVG